MIARIMFGIVCVALVACTSMAQSEPSAPASQPTTKVSAATMPADLLLQQMLRPAGGPAAKPLTPIENLPTFSQTVGAVVAPGPPTPTLIREGDYIQNRVGRLNKTGDGQFEFIFDSDGAALKDPPLIILPNLKLMQMESAVTAGNRDLKFRITGQVTEYKGKNYILIEKAVVPPDSTQSF
jgi:hypothetical protein